MPDYSALCGLHHIDDWDSQTHRSVEDFVAKLHNPVFEMSYAYKSVKGAGEDQNVFHWRAEEKALGRVLPNFVQTRGTCVSMGAGRACQDQFLIDIALRNEPEEIPANLRNIDWIVATEPIYAGSRVEIGGGRLGNSDGSVGAWAARWIVEYGVLFRQKYGSIDLSRADDEVAARWGRRGAGCPDELESVAREHPIVDASLCQTYEAARDAIATLNSVTVASNVGYTTVRKAGFCTPSGSWNHQMMYRGCGVAKGNRPFLVQQQSWPNSPTGPDIVTLETGEEVKLPKGCFCIDADAANRQLRQGDSYVVSGVKGFRRILPDDYADILV